MAYDVATGTVVLYGGYSSHSQAALNGTWTWDGTTWTQQHPATSPPRRFNASMAYDAATSTVVLFGGGSFPRGADPDATWTWDGTTWTQQHPATSPPHRLDASMAYDPATRTVVLFGGSSSRSTFGDTWTWG